MRLCSRRLAVSAAAILATVRPPSAVAKSRVDGYPVQTIDGREWIDVLSSGQFFILRQGGTEPPNSSPLANEKRRGVYVCAGCVNPLFDSTQKFESGTGWPSFASPRKGVEVVSGLLSSEVRCGRCGGHLGDVFSDGARFPGTRAAETGKRFCIDGAALVFVPSDEASGPLAGDGLTGRARLLPTGPRSTASTSRDAALQLRGGGSGPWPRSHDYRLLLADAHKPRRKPSSASAAGGGVRAGVVAVALGGTAGVFVGATAKGAAIDASQVLYAQAALTLFLLRVGLVRIEWSRVRALAAYVARLPLRLAQLGMARRAKRKQMHKEEELLRTASSEYRARSGVPQAVGSERTAAMGVAIDEHAAVSGCLAFAIGAFYAPARLETLQRLLARPGARRGTTRIMESATAHAQADTVVS